MWNNTRSQRSRMLAKPEIIGTGESVGAGDNFVGPSNLSSGEKRGPYLNFWGFLVGR